MVILAVAIMALPWMAIQPQLAPPGAGGADKFLHMSCFTGLALVGFWAFESRWARAVILAVLLLLGAGVEWVQASVPGREGSLGDLAADAAGLLLALILLRCWLLARDMLSPQED